MSAREAFKAWVAATGHGEASSLAERAFMAGYSAHMNESWAEVEDDVEGGQPNGSGILEPSSYREWYREDRETHHRRVRTHYGPWLEGAVRSVTE